MLRGAFGPPQGSDFCGLFSREVRELLRIRCDAPYNRVRLTAARMEEIPLIIRGLKRRTHVFCVTSDAPFRSPGSDGMGHIKLGVLPLFSTGFSVAKLDKALRIIKQQAYGKESARAGELINRLLGANRVIVKFRRPRTEAVLEFHNGASPVFFFNQTGRIEWGHQSVLPNGEVSLLTNSHGCYSEQSVFKLDGAILFDGYPVLHRGLCPCRTFRPFPAAFETRAAGVPTGGSDACVSLRNNYVPIRNLRSTFKGLSGLDREPIVAKVKKGIIQSVHPLTRRSQFAAKFEALLAADMRYRKVHEFAFGLSSTREVFVRENFLPNEMRLGVHFGLGLTPYTQFHLDLVCPRVSVFIEKAARRETLLRC